MQTWEGLLLAIGWFVLRFGVPIALTALAIWFFKRLDERWQAQARETRTRVIEAGISSTVRCWLINDCEPKAREQCVAFQQPKIPCWLHCRAADGQLQEKCLNCKVFRTAQVPVLCD